MPKASPIQTNFTSGEFSPKLQGRTDITRYANGAIQLENFLIEPYGGIVRRPGSVFVAHAKYPDKLCRLIPFQYSTIQSYVIEAGDLYFRFYRDNGIIVEANKTITNITQANPAVVSSAAHGYSNGDEIFINDVVGMTQINGMRFKVANVTAGTFELQDIDAVNIDSTGYSAYVSGGRANKIYEIATSFLEADLFDLQFAQTADIMYFAHKNHKPKKLSRLGDTNWTLADVVFLGGPFQTDNDDDTITVTPSATTGAITLTASSAIFNANMVGSLFKIHGTVGTAPNDIQGYVEITGFTSTTVVNATVKETLSATTATDNWAFGSFSDDAGYPQAVTFHEQRLFFGGTIAEPQSTFGSVILIFNDYTAGDNDDDAVKYEIATEQVNAIRFLSSARGLAIGTSGGVFVMSGGSSGVALTPDNVNVRRETTFGTELIIPKRIGNNTYYIERGGRRLREFSYNFDIDANRSLDMNLLAEHVTESGLTIMDYQQAPNSVIWAVRGDGQIAALTRQIDQEVTGWSRQLIGQTSTEDNEVESLAVIPTQSEEDEVWISVQREVNGTVRRFIEYFKPFNFGEKADAFFVDSGLSYSGVSTTTLSGLGHLEGETVSILSEGSVLPPRVVTNGRITLLATEATTKAHVGLAYKSKLKSLKLEAGSATGTAQGKISRIYELIMRFINTLGGKVGASDALTDPIKFRKTTDIMDSSPDLFSGDVRVPFTKGWSDDGSVYYIEIDQPLPMNILSIMPLLEVNDR